LENACRSSGTEFSLMHQIKRPKGGQVVHAYGFSLRGSCSLLIGWRKTLSPNSVAQAFLMVAE
jgi:hypothetical protein